MKLVPLLFLFVSLSSNASHNCLGKVNAVDVSADGSVMINVGSLGDGTKVCHLNRSHGEFTADACKAAFSLFMAAQMADKAVRLWFRNDTNPSCSKGHWADLADHGIYHVRVEN